MGLFDKLKESFGGDDKPKSFQVTFMEQKMGMTISSGKKEEALVTGGKLLFYRSYIAYQHLRRARTPERGQRV